jgi:ATP-binding cassette subfamily C protein
MSPSAEEPEKLSQAVPLEPQAVPQELHDEPRESSAGDSAEGAPGLTLQDLMLHEGARHETISGFRTVNPREVLLVQSGNVDLFLCHLDEQGKAGRRIFLHASAPGELLIGQQELGGFGLLAAAPGEARVLALPLPETPGLTVQCPELWRDPLLDWLRRISAVALDAPLPILAHAVSEGETVTARGADRYYPRKPLWVQPSAGTVRLEDGDVSGPGSLLPLLPNTWLSAEKDSVFSTLDFSQGLRQPGAPLALRCYWRNILRMVAADHQRLTELEKRRIAERASLDADTQKRGWQQLARVLKREQLEVLHQRSEAEPLLAACKAVGRSLQVRIEPPPRASANAPLEDIARASNLRVRRVWLSSGWWNLDGGPLVGWLKEDGRPVALIAPRAGSYLLHDPSDGSNVRVNAEVAQRLQAQAAMFYRRLPDRSIGLKELFSLALKGSRGDLLALLVLSAALGTLALAIPVATQFLFDEILPLGQLSYLSQLKVGLLLVTLCNVCFMFSYSVSLVRFGGRFGSDLATSMFDRLLTLPMPFYRKYAIGDLAQRALGITRIRDLVTGGTLTKIISSVFALMSFLLLVYYNATLSLMAGCLLFLNLLFSTQAGLAQLRLRRKAADLSGQVNGILYQILGGLPKLRVAGAESRFFAYWATRFAKQIDYEYRAGNMAAAMSVFNTAFPVLSTFLLFSFVGLSHDQVSTGKLLAFLAAFAQCTTAIASLSDAAGEVSGALPQLERTAPILAAVPEKDEQKIDPGELSGAIELNNVSFRYSQEGGRVLRKVSLKVEPREFVALVGGTGAGKSTVLNLLLGFDKPESGSVFYDKKDLGLLDVQAVRQQIGVVLQTGRIVKDSVYNNLASGRPLSIEQTWEALRMVGLDSDIAAMPMGLDTVISPETFSGGQAQRLMIARAIVSRPRIIFFDEATSALDNQTQSIVSSSLEQLNAARVVIAHRLSTIRAADRIYVFSQGEVVQVGSYDELSAVPGLFAELMARQQETA